MNIGNKISQEVYKDYTIVFCEKGYELFDENGRILLTMFLGMNYIIDDERVDAKKEIDFELGDI